MRFLGGGDQSWEGDQRKHSNKGSLRKLVMQIQVMPSPLVRVVKSPPLPGTREGDIVHKWKSLQKENLSPVFRTFPASTGSQWP